MKRLGIGHNMVTENYPEADGQMEHINRTLAQYLRRYTRQHPAAWLDFLPV